MLPRCAGDARFTPHIAAQNMPRKRMPRLAQPVHTGAPPTTNSAFPKGGGPGATIESDREKLHLDRRSGRPGPGFYPRPRSRQRVSPVKPARLESLAFQIAFNALNLIDIFRCTLA